ncbi:unnamed protein product [Clonostachys rosea]|uniref:DUF7600 domain-containing protein n=1 Tax=Bionectria ochroleuca TaxID=29856 RepID=A0ABY6UWS0_BIOOC|nr:unnamed protein product [Clonostachys rosea]
MDRRPRLAQTKCCIICGCDVWRPFDANENESWRQRYRIIYRDRESVTGVSGIATHRGSRGRSWYAPFDYNDSREYVGITNMPQDESICVMHHNEMDDPEYLSRYGFPMHQNCWSLLEKAYAPHSVPKETLFNTCKSLEGRDHNPWILDWGHEYEGAARIVFDGVASRRSIDDRVECPEYFDHDPCLSEGFQVLLNQGLQMPPSDIEVSPALEHSNDCFSLLPGDVRLLIADLLTTEELPNLRSASRAFYFVFNEESFWARRFRPGRERDWLFEASATQNVQQINWRTLYKITHNKEKLPASLRNRLRIWNLVRLIKNATPTHTIQSITSPVEFGPASEFDIWSSVACEYQSRLLLFPGETGSPEIELPRQKFQFSGPLAGIEVHFIQLGRFGFVCGITFIMVSRRTRHIGYTSRSTLSLNFREDPVGFNLAFAAHGIAGMQAVYSDGGMSKWLGNNRDMPQTRRLVLHSGITAVEGLFDVCIYLIVLI